MIKTRFTVRVATHPFGAAYRWLAGHLVQTVPEDVSICEYECQEPHCNIAKWALCRKRLPANDTLWIGQD